MVKKLGLTSLFNSSDASLSSSASFSTAASWQWPSCTQARTRSFRCDSPEIVSMRHQISHTEEEDDFKTNIMNPAYMLDPPAADDEQHLSRSVSDDSSESSISTKAAFVEEDDEDEAIVRSLRSNGRLLFEPEFTSSLVSKMRAAAFDGATALAIDSADPYGDFRRSMEEMVMSHGIDDWGWLEEMLGWYLSANGKSTHGLIVGAFVDMLTSASGAKGLLRPVNRGKHRTVTRTERSVLAG